MSHLVQSCGVNIICAMSPDLKKSTMDHLKIFIIAHQSQRYPWRIKSEDYRNKAKRDAAYDLLLSKSINRCQRFLCDNYDNKR